MALQLTCGSAVEYENILYGRMTPEMAADYLREERISIRSFSDTLKQLYPQGNVLERLKAFYRENRNGEKLSSLDRKLQNWVTGNNHPTKREDYFRIAFALGLTESQLNFLMGICTDYTIQYRDGREVVLTWFLRNEYSYGEALDFLNKHAGKKGSASSGSDQNEFGSRKDSSDRYAVEGLEASSALNGHAGRWYQGASAHGYTEASRLTHEVRNEFQMARNIEELEECYLRNLERFGQMHLRSYYYFRQYLKQLIQPLSVYGESEMDYSIETVMSTYLSFHMPSGKRRSQYSLVQRLIKHNWPNLTSVRKILNRTEDVPRKLLLLLYVVTENSDYRSAYNELDEEYVSLEERVEDHWWTLNAMLTECGMASLDLRNAFDWLILYAISSDGEESMSSRLEGVIDALYGDINKS